MIAWSYGTVMRIVRDEEALQELEVRLVNEEVALALNYPELTGRASPEECVIVNTTAVELGLDSGGKHFVTARLSPEGTPLSGRGEVRREGHIVKMRYTPFQHTVQSVEEKESEYHEIFQKVEGKTLGRIPVVIGEVHSMLPAFVLSLWHLWRRAGESKMPRVCYIMSEGGALPLALSDHVRYLQSASMLTGTLTYGHAFGGQTECVNLYTALLAAKYVWKADVIVVAPGPGVAGTGTKFGFSGMEQITIIEAAHKLGGLPVLIPRVSFADGRDRHTGISHHTLTVLRFVPEVPLVLNVEHHPKLIGQLQDQSVRHTIVFHEPKDMEIWRNITESYPVPLVSMGRTIEDDPAFFAHMYYAARFIWMRCLKREEMKKMDLFS